MTPIGSFTKAAAAAGLAIVLLAVSSPTRPATAAAVDCGSSKVHCVDDDPGPMQEYDSIQRAVDRARRGHTVVVAAGRYDGFRVSRSGNKKKQIVVRGEPGAIIVAAEAGSDDGIYLSRASYVTIEGFEVDGSAIDGYGIGVHDATGNNPVRGVEILDNVVHDAGSTNIYVSHARDSTIEGNTAYDSRASHGIYLANGGSDDTTVRGNACYGNATNGIHFNGDASVGGDGIHTGLVIESNRVWGNAANGIDADGVQDSLVRNNLVYGNGRHGLRAFAIDAAAGPARLTIVNNTFVGNGSWAIKLTQDEGGHEIFNNILLSDDGSLAVDNVDLRSDYNIVQLEFSIDGEATVISWAAWQGLGFGPHSFKAKANKLFEKPNKTDYTLRRKSPAIDAGAAALDGISAPDEDIDGLARPQGKAPDVGAFERSGAAREGAA